MTMVCFARKRNFALYGSLVLCAVVYSVVNVDSTYVRVENKLTVENVVNKYQKRTLEVTEAIKQQQDEIRSNLRSNNQQRRDEQSEEDESTASAENETSMQENSAEVSGENASAQVEENVEDQSPSIEDTKEETEKPNEPQIAGVLETANDEHPVVVVNDSTTKGDVIDLNSFRTTRGDAYKEGSSDSPYFTLIADPQTGGDSVMRALDQQELVCASGGYAHAALDAQDLPWIGVESVEKGCLSAFIRDTIQEMTADAPHENNENWKPAKCVEGYDIESDPLKEHLPRLCKYIEVLNNDYSKENILRVFVDNFVEDNGLTGCGCDDSAKAKGLRLAANEIGERVPLHATAAVGKKMIRLTRRNLFEVHMSFVISLKTNMWTIETEEQRQEKMDAFKKLNYYVDVDDMIFDLHKLEEECQATDAWAQEYGGEIMWVDYSQLRHNSAAAYQKLFEFVGGSSEEASTIIRYLTDSRTVFELDGKSLLQYVANPYEVQEALAAHGYGHLVGVNNYIPIHHIIYDTEQIVRNENRINGLNVTVVEGTKESNRFNSALPSLESMPSETLVILSRGQVVSRNPHVRVLTILYREIAKMRRTFDALTKDHPNSVVATAAWTCCSDAMTQTEPGSLVAKGGERKGRTCKGAECVSDRDDKSEIWKDFMHSLANKDAGNVYLDPRCLVGRAGDLAKLIRAVDIEYGEDERAVFSDYLYSNPGSIVLDYEESLVGSGFDGVKSKLTDHSKSEATPLFLEYRDEIKPVVLHESNPFWKDDNIPIQPILDHIDGLTLRDEVLPDIDLYFRKEMLYIVDKEGIWVTERELDIYRAKPTENFLVRAHNKLVKSTSTRWKSLRKAMETAGFMYFAWYGDWKGCNSGNKGEHSIPLFTTCALKTCDHSFPTPTYMTIIDSPEDSKNWLKLFNDFDQQYPWDSKIRKVVWRGSLSENNVDKVFDSSRWRLMKKVHELTDQAQKDMFDVGFTNIPEFLTAQIDINVDEVGGIAPSIEGGMNGFQKYSAIIDMDGNSWSSRFGTMLCYNSVAIKVEPAYEDYFLRDLVPWKHYVPIKDDLSDLIETVSFVLDPKNDHIMQEIIASANKWCSIRFTQGELVNDMLDIWEGYVHLLDNADPNWVEKWAKKKDELFASQDVELIKVQHVE